MTIVRGQSERKKTGNMMGLWSLFLPDATQVEVESKRHDVIDEP